MITRYAATRRARPARCAGPAASASGTWLRLIDCEFPLPNAVGTRGGIDILARDQHGLWVVIELKRSNEAAGRALHEVAKYTELLCREKHIPADRIRAIIVSTIWTELLVPVSHMARDWTHDLRGFHRYPKVGFARRARR